MIKGRGMNAPRKMARIKILIARELGMRRVKEGRTEGRKEGRKIGSGVQWSAVAGLHLCHVLAEKILISSRSRRQQHQKFGTSSNMDQCGAAT